MSLPTKKVDGRSPERAALAAAQERVKELSAAYEKALDAEARGREALDDAIGTHAEAERAVAAAKAAETRAILDGARAGGVAPSSGALSKARAAHVEAADRVDSAREAYASLQADRQQREAERQSAMSRVQDAALEVLRPAADALVDEIIEAQRALVRMRVSLRWLLKSRVVSNPGAALAIMQRAMLPDAEATFGGHHEFGWPIEWEIGALQPSAGGVVTLAGLQPAGNMLLAGVLAPLLHDPDAPVPTFGARGA